MACVTSFFAYKYDQYLIFAWLHPSATAIAHDVRPQIINALFAHISKMLNTASLSTLWS